MNNTKDYVSDILKGIFLLSYIYITLIAITYIKSEICGIPKYAIYIISAVIVCSVIIYMRKEKRCISDYRPDKSENIFLLIASVVLLFVQVVVVWNAVFRTAWDPGAVWYGAHYVSLGDRAGIESMAYYFSVYPNNLILVFIYSVILKLNMLIGSPISNGTMLLAFFSCFLISVTGVLFFKTAKKVVGCKGAWIGYIFYFILVGLSGWILIPYSDSTGIIFPILMLYIYISMKETKNIKRKFLDMFFLVLFGNIGFKIKPMAAIVLIAIIAIEGLELIRKCLVKEKIDIKVNIAYILCGVCGMLMAFVFVNTAIKTMNFPVVTENILGWQHHMMLGLNKDTNGGYSQEDFDYSTSFATSEEQHAAEYAKIKQRLEDFGVLGYMDHFVKKSARNYFDASFGWGGLGDSFYTEIFPERDNKLCPIIRSLYYDNNDENLYKYNLLARQTMWYIVICLMPFAAWTRGKLDYKNKVLLLSVLGLMMYLQIFEAHARYVFTFVPLYIIVACLGMKNLVHKIEND